MPSAHAQAAAKTFVLVHGAWHGGWCWRRVSDLLETKGPQGVHADHDRARRALASPEQGHQPRYAHHRHRQCLQVGRPARTFAWSRTPMAAGRARARSSRSATGCPSIVWLDAFKPEDGQRGRLRLRIRAARRMAEAVARGDAGRPGRLAAKLFGSTRRIRPGSTSKLTRSRSASRLQPIKLTGAREKVARKPYIRAPKLSADGVRQGLCRVQGRPVVEDAGSERRPRCDDRRAGLAGRPDAGIRLSTRHEQGERQ